MLTLQTLHLSLIGQKIPGRAVLFREGRTDKRLCRQNQLCGRPAGQSPWCCCVAMKKSRKPPVATGQNGLQIIMFEIFVLETDMRFVAHGLAQDLQFGFDHSVVAPWHTIATGWPAWAQTG